MTPNTPASAPKNPLRANTAFQRTAAAPHLVNNTFTRKLTDNHDEIVKVLINSQT